MAGVIDSLAGSFLLGSFFNVFLAGINWMQILTYFNDLRHEQRIYIWMVSVVGLIGLTHSCFAVVTMYHQLVTHYGEPETLLKIHWTYVMDPIMTAVVAVIVQAFYAYRVYILSQRRIMLPILILFLSVVQLGVGAFTTGFALMHPTWPYVGEHISWAVSSWLFIMAGTDIIITGSIVYLLGRRRSDFQGTNSIIDSVIRYTITNNGLTAAAAIASSLMFQRGPGLWHIIPGTIIIKFYAISLVASLNSRKGLAQDLMASRHGPTVARSSPKHLTSGRFSFSHSPSPVPRSPKALQFKDSPVRGGAGGGGVHGSLNHSRAASVRDVGESSFPVQVTIDTTSSEYRVEDLDWEEKGRKQNKSLAAHESTGQDGSPTISQAHPPFQFFVDKP